MKTDSYWTCRNCIQWVETDHFSKCAYQNLQDPCCGPVGGSGFTPRQEEPHPGVNEITDVYTQHKRAFATGATRDTDAGKIDYEGFLSPAVLERFGAYMTKHRQMADGSLRESDNWQKGIPRAAYMKSAWRHFVDWWKGHRGATDVDVEESVCALIFNAQGYLHELLKRRGETPDR